MKKNLALLVFCDTDLFWLVTHLNDFVPGGWTARFFVMTRKGNIGRRNTTDKECGVPEKYMRDCGPDVLKKYKINNGMFVVEDYEGDRFLDILNQIERGLDGFVADSIRRTAMSRLYLLNILKTEYAAKNKIVFDRCLALTYRISSSGFNKNLISTLGPKRIADGGSVHLVDNYVGMISSDQEMDRYFSRPEHLANLSTTIEFFESIGNNVNILSSERSLHEIYADHCRIVPSHPKNNKVYVADNGLSIVCFDYRIQNAREKHQRRYGSPINSEMLDGLCERVATTFTTP